MVSGEESSEVGMSTWVECVPNFSEGRDAAVLSELESAISGVAGVHLLDVHADSSHHRSVYTFAGEPGPVGEAAFRAINVSVDRIDLTNHSGEHPRIGAADVVPFIPLTDATPERCVELARGLGKRVARELDLPVYLYGHASTLQDRRDLTAVRRGEFEALRAAVVTDPTRAPDYGPRKLHPTAGASIH